MDTPICVHIICGCFWIKMAALSNAYGLQSQKYLLSGALLENLSTSDLAENNFT